MTPRQVLWTVAICSAMALAVLVSGCGLFTARTTSRVPTAMVSEKKNGFLLELPGNERHPHAEAFISHGRWVIVTVVDPLYDLAPLERISSPHIDSLAIDRFATAIQISLRFRQILSEANVVSSPGDPTILISIFTP